ncbi:hypothetical protein ACHAQA_008480 [Verticillium albo-atrum]
MRFEKIILAVSTAASLATAAPAPVADSVESAAADTTTEDDAIINWDILEDYEVIELENGVKFLGEQIKSPNEAARVRRALETRQTRDSCGASSFENQTSGGSPTVNDCAVVCNTAHAADWWIKSSFCGNVWNGGSSTCYNPMIWYGSCVFGAARKYSGTGNYDGAVGASDIGDLVRDSINWYQSGGRVGSRGEMKCRIANFGDPAHYTATTWGLYHT